MKVWTAVLLALLTLAICVPGWLWAQGFANTYSLVDGSVVVSNSQANSSWVTVSVMIRYAAPSTGAAEVRRVSQGQSFVLGACAFTNVTSLVWVPDVAYSFTYGDALVIASTVTNGAVQVIRKGE